MDRMPAVAFLGSGHGNPPFRRRTDLFPSLDEPDFCGATMKEKPPCAEQLGSPAGGSPH